MGTFPQVNLNERAFHIDRKLLKALQDEVGEDNEN